MGYLKRIPSLLLFTILSSCNWTTDHSSALLDKVSSLSEEKAVSIIHYNNGLVQLTDAQLEYITYVTRNLKIIEQGLGNPSKPIGISKITDVFYFNIKELKNVNEEIPFSAFDKSQVEFFENNVNLMNQTFEDLRMQYQNLENYILAGHYYQDKGKEGKQLVGDVQKIIEDYYDLNDLVMYSMLDLSIEAENKILENHPLKDFIFKMRDCSDMITEIVDKAHDRLSHYTEDKEYYEEKLQLIKKRQGELLQMNKKPLEEFEGKLNQFEGFMGALNDFLFTTQNVMSESELSGKINSENVNELLITEEYLRVYYNDFVD